MSEKGGTTLSEKIRKRRKALKESLTDSTMEYNETPELELSSTKRSTNEVNSSRRHTQLKEEESSFTEQPLDELRDAEKLMSDLKTRRAEKKKELSKIDKDIEEPSKASDAGKKTKKTKKITTHKDEEKEELWPVKEEKIATEDVDKIREQKIITKRKKRMKQEDKTEEKEKIEVEESEAKELIDAVMTATTQAPNINASIRERIKKKMNEVKEKAEEKVKEEIKSDPHKGRAGRKLRGLRDRPITTRFDDPSILTKEEIEEDKNIQEKITAKSRWRSAMKTLKAKESDMPTPEEIEDFFSRNFEPEAQPITPPTVTREGPKEEEEEEEAGKSEGEKEDKEKEPLLTTNYFDTTEDWKIKPIELKGVDYRPHQNILDNERKAYFMPRMISVPHSEKIPEGNQPRYLEDEGLFVGVRPPINQRNVNIEEHRLLERSDKGTKWFGEDGRIKALPDPLKGVVCRPSFLTTEDRDPALRSEYKKATMTGFDSRFIDGSSDTHGKFQVDVDINSITFSHHALFSKENVLSSSLQQLYKQYLTRSKQNIATFLIDKIKALNSAIVHIQNQKNNLSNADDLNSSLVREHGDRLVEYKNEIRQTKKLRNMELKNDRELLKNILKKWKQIKELRESQGYVNTPVKISFRKEDRSKAEDMEEMKREIEEELNERKAEYDENFHEQMEKYAVDLEEWKKYKILKKNKLKKKAKSKKRGSQEDLVASSVEDMQDEDEPEVPKPKEPSYQFDEAKLSSKLKEEYLQIRRKPGEPFLVPELAMSAVITPTHNCPRKEQLRRKEVQSCKCFVRVLFNNKEVSRTIPVTLSSDFMIHFGDIFNVQIVQWPESIKYEVYEAGTLSDTLLAELYTPIPDSQVTSENVQLSEIEFSSNQQLSYEHSGVGSGVPFQLGSDNNSQEQILLTSGTLMASVSWALGDDGSVLVPPSIQSADYNLSGMKQYDALAAIGATGMVDMEKLSQWINESHLDPNDPANASLLHFIKTIGHTGRLGGGVHAPDYFRLEQLQQEFDFCTDEEIQKSKRFRLIQLREQEIPEFKGKKIPAREREVDEKIFINYEKKKEEEKKDEIREDMDPHRQAVARFLGRVREQVMARFREAEHQYTLDDVVNEQPVPNISMISINLKRLAEPRRPLRPSRKERKVVTAHNLGLADVKIIANIERAFKVPSRKDESIVPRKEDDYGLVRPFVEVVFQKNLQQTTVAEGSNPSWNEELQLPFKAPNNDYSTDTLQSVKDLVYFNLFDEVLIDILEDDRDRDTKIHKRREKRWLGSITIPFTTIYFQGRVEGVFRVEAPPVLLGYEQRGTSGGGSSSIASYLSLFIAIEPALAMPERAKEKFDTNEDERLLLYAENFQMEIEKKFPKREILTTVMDVNGKSVFSTRYFKPLKPPEELLKDEKGCLKQAIKIAKFVASIPFVSDSVVFPGLCDIWSTCEQFLQMLQGDEEEHAVLLCNYFLYLGKKAWIVIGNAIPEGPTSYVLTLDGKANVTVWNPSTGERFLQHDHYSPLKHIGCLIGQDNIWANIQPHDEPSRVNFDLTNTSDWKPFFSKNFPNPGLTSIQVEELTYFQTDRGFVAELQEKIEKKLKEKLMEWRTRHVTRWNRYITQTFRKLLRNLEEHQGQELIDLHRNELESITKDYSLCGFPLHITYTEMQPVIDAVFSTGVHWNEAVDVEFALAVHIHPYPNSVLSLWVYIASVLRKR